MVIFWQGVQDDAEKHTAEDGNGALTDDHSYFQPEG